MSESDGMGLTGSGGEGDTQRVLSVPSPPLRHALTCLCLSLLSALSCVSTRGRHVAAARGASSKDDVSDPCLNVGYTRDAAAKRKDVYEGPEGQFAVAGSASADTCAAAVDTALFPATEDDACRGQKGPFSFNCVHQPAFVAASRNFLIFENFYYVASALGIGGAAEQEGEKDGEGAKKEGGEQFPIQTTPAAYQKAAKYVTQRDAPSPHSAAHRLSVSYPTGAVVVSPPRCPCPPRRCCSANHRKCDCPHGIMSGRMVSHLPIVSSHAGLSHRSMLNRVNSPAPATYRHCVSCSV